MNDSELNAIERLSSIIHDDGVDIDKLSTQELRVYLEKQGVDVKSGETRFAKFLKWIEGQRKLQIAAERRRDAIACANALVPGMVDLSLETLETVRERVKALFQQIQAGNPDQVAVYNREFEKATLEDLLSMEEDLRLIQENEKRNQ